MLRHPDLLAMVREKLSSLLNGYIRTPQLLGKLHEYVCPRELGDDAGVLGAIALAQR